MQGFNRRLGCNFSDIRDYQMWEDNPVIHTTAISKAMITAHETVIFKLTKHQCTLTTQQFAVQVIIFLESKSI